ncbi:MAG: LuxR family transcriptional regulator [Methylacidiphilales bacterium]|nr:LuxR family transcriptional regulator [Candidatus Methylacidiphilales bacterium]
MVDHARLAFAAVERLENVSDPQQLIGTFQSCLDPFGFNIVLITGLPDPPADPTPFFLLNSWPSGWHDRYIEEDFYRDDPVAAAGRTQIDPFAWSEAPVNPERQPRALQVMDEAASVGMRDGFVVPILTSRSVQACVSVAGDLPDLSLDTRRMVHLVAMYAHARAMRLHAGSKALPKRRLLSDREREVLVWSASGKTAWETSCILGISERTVTYHITMAARRLQAVSRTHAVARAIALGEISIS